MNKRTTAFVGAAALALGAQAGLPTGFRFGEHLTIKPYLNVAYTYDSNLDTTHHGEDDSIFSVTPGANAEWKGDRWSLSGNAWYRYKHYAKNNSEMGEDSYGEGLTYKFASSEPNQKGWSLMLAERYQNISASDSINSGDGRGIWRDRERINATAALERRFSSRFHMGVMGQYDWLDYKNGSGYAPLYGWSSWSTQLEGGYAITPWTDVLLAGGYSHYKQKGTSATKNTSESYTVMAGLGTRATRRIEYRALAGASWLNYGGHNRSDSGWTYQLDGNWKITRTLNFSVRGSSYYQPSERYAGNASKIYALSTGLSYLTLGDHLRLTGDVMYRHEENCYYTGSKNADEDTVSFRVGGQYTINRWVSVFTTLTWEKEWYQRGTSYDYDRFRGTVGLQFHY